MMNTEGIVKLPKRIFRHPKSKFLHMRYFHKGKLYRESTEEIDPKKAEKKLKDKLAEIRMDKKGKLDFVPNTQLRVSDLLDALEADYKLRGIKSLPEAHSHLKPVRAELGNIRVRDLTSDSVDRYIDGRLKKGMAGSTINRETQKLGTAFRLAVEDKKLTPSAVPRIRRLSEKGRIRRGFFEKAEFAAFLDQLPSYLKGYIQFGYRCGWRKSEVGSLEWSDVDLLGRVIRLRPENSKNEEGGVLVLKGELWSLIERQWKMRQFERKNKTIGASLYVFHRDGHPIGDIRKAWSTAFKKAGLVELPPKHPERKTFHAFRRTAVRDMTRAGVQEVVAMSITTHKTRSIFDRYNIVSEKDIGDAVLRTEQYLESIPAQQQVVEMPEPAIENVQ